MSSAADHDDANSARFVYPDPASRDFSADWDQTADDIVAILRSEADRNPHDKAITELIGEQRNSPPTPGSRSSSAPRRPAAHQPTRSPCSPAGPRPRNAT